MNLPPVPEPLCQFQRYTYEQMQAYGKLCVNEHIKQQTRGLSHAKPKYSNIAVAAIRLAHAKGFGYKEINKQFPMSRELFFRIVGHKGAYK